MTAHLRPQKDPIWCLSILTTPEAEDAAGEILLRLTGESPILTHDRTTGWSTAAVYSPRRDLGDPALRRSLRAEVRAIATFGLDPGPGKISWRRVPAADWTESWKRHFPALKIGGRLLVRPSWDRTRLPRNTGGVEVVLDPGLSFGTGQHPTTEFCLRELVRRRPRSSDAPRSLLDIGTGSGILAIAAAKLGYSPVAAFDFDPEAVAIAGRNAADNAVAAIVRPECRDVRQLSIRPRTRFDLVCANLTADLLLQHAKAITAQVKPGGHLVLAGILAEEFDRITDRFESLGLTADRQRHRAEWKSGSFQAQPG